MKKNKLAFCLAILLAVVNIFCVRAADIQYIKNLNASATTVYFNFENGTETTGDRLWTISFNRTSIEANTGTSIQVVDQSFEQLIAAPKAGYEAALEKGSGKSWYEYDMLSHSITPLTQKTIVVKLPSGKYAKIEIQNYYKDGKGDSGYYTFRYEFIK